MTEAVLERRYRRLLTCYPIEHRLVYGDEMIGVLLASTPADRRRPGLADTLSLFGGGLRVRLRGLLADSPDPGWRYALALTTLIVPVLLAALAWQQIGWHLAFAPSARFGRLDNAALLLIPLALGLLRLRPLAAIAAALSLIWVVGTDARDLYLRVPSTSVFVVLMSVQAVAFASSRGPLHALRLIRPRAVVMAMPWLLGAAYVTNVIPAHYPVPTPVAEIGVVVIALIGLPALATAGGRRLFVLIVAIPASAAMLTVLTFAQVNFYAFSQLGQLVALYLPPAVLAGLTFWLVNRAGQAYPPPEAGVAG